MNNLVENNIARATKRGVTNAYNSHIGHQIIGSAIILLIIASATVGYRSSNARTWLFNAEG